MEIEIMPQEFCPKFSGRFLKNEALHIPTKKRS